MGSSSSEWGDMVLGEMTFRPLATIGTTMCKVCLECYPLRMGKVINGSMALQCATALIALICLFWMCLMIGASARQFFLTMRGIFRSIPCAMLFTVGCVVLFVIRLTFYFMSLIPGFVIRSLLFTMVCLVLPCSLTQRLPISLIPHSSLLQNNVTPCFPVRSLLRAIFLAVICSMLGATCFTPVTQ